MGCDGREFCGAARCITWGVVPGRPNEFHACPCWVGRLCVCGVERLSPIELPEVCGDPKRCQPGAFAPLRGADAAPEAANGTGRLMPAPAPELTFEPAPENADCCRVKGVLALADGAVDPPNPRDWPTLILGPAALTGRAENPRCAWLGCMGRAPREILPDCKSRVPIPRTELNRPPLKSFAATPLTPPARALRYTLVMLVLFTIRMLLTTVFRPPYQPRPYHGWYVS